MLPSPFNADMLHRAPLRHFPVVSFVREPGSGLIFRRSGPLIGHENLLTARRRIAMFTVNLIESGRGTGPMKPRQPPRPAMR